MLGRPDFGPKKITVNAIAPGGVKTDLFWETVRRYFPASMSDEVVASVSVFPYPFPSPPRAPSTPSSPEDEKSAL